MSTTFIECEKLSYNYHRGNDSVPVLQDLDLTINQGEFIALMGPSGSGKSTLLNLLGGLDKPSAGSIRVQGVELADLPSKTLAQWRATTVGFIFQFYNLIPVLSAQRNVELPLLLTPLTAAERKKQARMALEIVGLGDRTKHKPDELSGGQQQRVAIARAIAADPQLLVCDEPTGDLDRTTAEHILELLQVLNRDHGKTIVMVTHDPKAATYAQATLHMDKGALACPTT